MFAVSRADAKARSVWNNQVSWQERVIRQALPDQFETDRTYMRVPGAQCPACGIPDRVVQGLYVPNGERLYVVHGCQACGNRTLLSKDAEIGVAYA
jgi:hypothetical protein